MASTLAPFGTAFAAAFMANAERHRQEDRDRFAIVRGERRRKVGELSPCTFLGQALTVKTVIAEMAPEVHSIRIGPLELEFTASYGRLSWKLEFSDHNCYRHFCIASESGSNVEGVDTPESCMIAAERELAKFKKKIASLGCE